MTRGLFGGLNELAVSFRNDGAVSVWQRHVEGTHARGLPAGCPDLAEQFEVCQRLLVDRYRTPRHDGVDVTDGWVDDDSRRMFLVLTGELRRDLQNALGSRWSVEVAPEPALVRVRLAGEHSCDWPLWTTSHGGTGPEDWPQVSAEIGKRLTDWAIRAVPDHYPQPSPDETELLSRDLQAELGERCRVTLHPRI